MAPPRSPSARRAPRCRSAVAVAAAVLAACAPAARAALPQQAGRVDLATQANVEIVGAHGTGDGTDPADHTGFSVAPAGDVNGDGIDDVVVGAPGYDGSGAANAGAAYVVYGSRTPTTVDLSNLGARGFRMVGAAHGDSAGISVAGGGDVNGDGLDDVVVGASSAAGDAAGSGSAYVVFGSRSEPQQLSLGALGTGGFAIKGGAANDDFGHSVALIPDMNGDGRSEVAVAAPSAAGGAGTVSVVFGKIATSAVDSQALGGAGFTITGPSGASAGRGLASAGDVNHDGRGDVLVGAPGAGSGQGAAYVVYGRAATTGVALGALDPATTGFTMDGYGQLMGEGVASGSGALLVTSGDESYNNAGHAFAVFPPTPLGNVSLNPIEPDGYRLDGATGEWLGRSIGALGDFDGDGTGDVIVGAQCASPAGRTHAGAAYIVSGAPATTVTTATLGARGTLVEGPAAVGGTCPDDGNDRRVAVAPAGDFNGDGRPDALVGVPRASDDGRPEAGSVSVLFGYGTPTIAYASPTIDVAQGAAIAPIAPAIAHTGPASFAVAPALPAGLSLDPATGRVAGTPTAPEAATVHTITMVDLAGTATAALTVTVHAPPVAPVVAPPDSDGDGTPDAQDCQPLDPTVHPGAVEITNNGKDDNCDGLQAVDADHDGHLAKPLGDDCNDNDAHDFPGNPEIPGNGHDENCDGRDTPLSLLPHVGNDEAFAEYPDRRHPRQFGVSALDLSGLVSGSRIVLACSGHGCPTPRSRSFTVSKAEAKHGMHLARAFPHRLLPGAQITLTVTKAGFRGRVYTLRFAAGHQPVYRERCVATTGKVGACPA